MGKYKALGVIILLGTIGSVIFSMVISLSLNISFNSSVQIFGWTNWLYLSSSIALILILFIYDKVLRHGVITNSERWFISFFGGLGLTLFIGTIGKLISVYLLEGTNFITILSEIVDGLFISSVILYLPIVLCCNVLFRVYERIINRI